MKLNILKVTLGILLCLSVLMACSDQGNSDQSSGKNDPSATGQNNDNNEGQSEADNKDDGQQSKLQIGDTGTVKIEYQGTFKVTLESVEQKEKIGSENPNNDVFLVAKVKVENVGKEAMDLEDLTGFVDLLDLGKNGGSAPDYANQIQGVQDPLSNKGQLQPGKTAEGDMVFDTWNTDNYQFVFGHANSQVSKTIWAFTKDELK
ncbi:putative cupin superfamily protein [Pullulanibacillus pueri]|uniref:DUF4352 domain-containing protein n=1 Tax=Pullulanibacillus pueri TaxID=1437324 RepID=A0A8J2ZTY3_9BACL|nr:DUF4352 domain-containing protein [Pullulanibacillus pueri]MBM7681323.1 putative cupin superfamily protein [Pullulanibacillus pueri]GGH77591.1 hypothetical protein GCM10007096_09710 [Pullulanibacillus pueri]